MPKLNTHTAKDPVSRHATTEYNRYQRVVSRLRDLYASTIAYARTFDQYLEAKERITTSKDYARLTTYYRGKFSGVDDALFSALYEGENAPLMHVKLGADGRVFLPGDDTWLNESTEYKSSMKCMHAWRTHHARTGEVRYW